LAFEDCFLCQSGGLGLGTKSFRRFLLWQKELLSGLVKGKGTASLSKMRVGTYLFITPPSTCPVSELFMKVTG
jgi:hypothetical protein